MPRSISDLSSRHHEGKGEFGISRLEAVVQRRRDHPPRASQPHVLPSTCAEQRCHLGATRSPAYLTACMA